MVNVTIIEPGTKFNLEHGGVNTFISVWSEICWGSRASQVSDRVAHQLWVFTMSSRVWYSPFPPTAVFQLSRFSAQTWKRYESNNQQKSNILELVANPFCTPVRGCLVLSAKTWAGPVGVVSAAVVPSRWLLGVAEATTEFLQLERQSGWSENKDF